MTGTLSFCIITNGARPQRLELVKKSIHAQNLSDYEIIIVGDHRPEAGIIYIPAVEAAQKGKLGIMRNLGVARARGDYVVILDDDILLTLDWSQNLQAYAETIQIMTSKIRLPDGTRYWDHASYRGPNGQALLDDDQDSPGNIYMSGGTAWVMHKKVWEKVKWNEELGFYEKEDIDFSQRCYEQGFSIRHNPRCVAYHCDYRYTRFAKGIFMRKDESWYLNLPQKIELSDPNILYAYIDVLLAEGKVAELFDIVRAGAALYPKDQRFLLELQCYERVFGGPCSGDRWYLFGDPVFRWLLLQFGRQRLDNYSRDELAAGQRNLDAWVAAANVSEDNIVKFLEQNIANLSAVLPFLTTLHLEHARNNQQDELLDIFEKITTAMCASLLEKNLPLSENVGLKPLLSV